MRALKKGEKYYEDFFDGCWEFWGDSAARNRFTMDDSVIVEWYEQFSMLPEGALFFDEDFKLAAGPQRGEGKHFHEWQAAIILYQKYGYLSLNEKYESWRRHHEKFQIFSRLAGPEFANFAANNGLSDEERCSTDQRQCPDLLVYRPDFSDWFFCEVKAGEDVSDSQKEFFPIVRQRTGKPIYLLVFN